MAGTGETGCAAGDEVGTATGVVASAVIVGASEAVAVATEGGTFVDWIGDAGAAGVVAGWLKEAGG